jgi:hypothetical protein
LLGLSQPETGLVWQKRKMPATIHASEMPLLEWLPQSELNQFPQLLFFFQFVVTFHDVTSLSAGSSNLVIANSCE